MDENKSIENSNIFFRFSHSRSSIWSAWMISLVSSGWIKMIIHFSFVKIDIVECCNRFHHNQHHIWLLQYLYYPFFSIYSRFRIKTNKKKSLRIFSISEIHGRKWYLKFYPFISFQMYILFNNEYFACKPFCWIFEPYTSGENAIQTHDHLMAIRPYPHKINDLFHNWRGKPLVNKYTESVESVALQCIFNP